MQLKEYILKRGVSQRFVAQNLGITISHLRAIITGNGMPSRKLAYRIEAFTNGEVTKEEAIFNEPKQEETHAVNHSEAQENRQPDHEGFC